MPPELREALEAAVTQAETTNDAPATTPESPAVPEQQPASAEVKQETTPVADTPVEEGGVSETEAKPESGEGIPPKPAEGVKEETPEQKAVHRVDRPPQSWKKEAKGEWANLPLHVRQEVYRREQQVNQVMIEASKNREAVEQLNKVITPYAARLQTMGGVIPAIDRLVKAEYTLATGSRQEVARYMAQLIKDYDVDILELDSVLSGQAPSAPQQPDISSLVQQQVQQAIAPLLQQQQAVAQRRQQEAVVTVEEMSLDPQYPYFEDVREDMADIIEMKAKKGLAITLPEAYAIAVQLNPQTASQMKQQATIQTATQQHQQAQRAKVASSSITGSPASGGSLTSTGDGSLRGAIEAAFGTARL